MACININLPEYKQLVKSLTAIGVSNPVRIQARIMQYQAEYNTDEFPPIDYFTIPHKQYVNARSNQEELLNINPQPGFNNVEEVDEEFEKLIVSRLSQFNVKIDILNDLRKTYGVDSLGVVDILHKIVHVAATRNYDTLSESAAHMLVGLVGTADVHLAKLYDLITKWGEYESIKTNYLALYNNDEERVKILAMGKIISQSVSKVYKDTKGDSNLLTKAREALESVINYIIHAFGIKRDITLVADKYLSKLSDKIAIEFLSGNMVKEFKTIPEGHSLVNYENAFNNFPNAKKINNLITKNKNVKLTGSLALSLQGSVYRDINEPIHDLDYMAASERDVEDVYSLLKPEGAIEAHYGIIQGDDKTISFYIPEQGHKIIVKERLENENSKWKGFITNFDIITPEGTNIGQDYSKILNIDFFIRSEKAFDDSTNSWSSIFEGKKMISNKSPRLFGRLKDVRDFINFDQYFPEYNHLTPEERLIFVKGVENGDITINCKVGGSIK